jgi:hypothetical protein
MPTVLSGFAAMTRFSRTVSLAVALGLLTLVVVTCAQAGAPPGAGTFTTNFCTKLEARIGADRLGAALGTSTACATTLTPVVLSALATCRSSAAPSPVGLRACARLNVVAAVKQMLGVGASQGTVDATGTKLAQRVCSALSARAPARFARFFTDEAGCESKLTTLAQTSLQGCAGTANPGTSVFRACVISALRGAVKTQASSG